MGFEHFLKFLVGAVVVVGLGYWLTLPNDSVALDPTCKVADLDQQLREALHPDAFWKTQLAALKESRGELERLQATSHLGLDSNSGANKIETPIEKKMDRLSDQAAQESQSSEEQKARIERIAWMTKCESVVSARVGSK